MGGFAGFHHRVVRELEATGICRLICTCDPRIGMFTERQHDLAFNERGVRIFEDYSTMLDECRAELDVVTIPTPVPLHAPMHRACVDRGLAAYLEKPPTLDWQEYQEMLAVEGRAPRLTNVGFNYLVDHHRQALKERLVSGEFGPLRKVGVLGLWPRNGQYYARTPWAGRLMLDGGLVLDSCLGNAMAHLTHSALFWSGRTAFWAWGQIEAVSVELYRAHEIEGADTFFLQASIEGGASVSLAMSHACAGLHRTEERVECEKADLTYMMGPVQQTVSRRYEIRWRDGRVEAGTEEGLEFLTANLADYFGYLCGRKERPLNRLVDCQPFVSLNGLAYIAARKITTIPGSVTGRTKDVPAREDFAAIPALDGIAERFLATGTFPSGQGLSWAAPGGRAGMEDLPALRAVVEEMRAARDSGQYSG